MEACDLSPETLDAVHRDLTRTHRVLGSHRKIALALRRGRAVRSLLDLGCGRGDLLITLEKELGVTGIGVELCAQSRPLPIPIFQLDAVHDCLPRADVAVAVFLIHHLSDDEVCELVRNVRRSCRRLLILDLVRHWLPLYLFNCLLAPWLHPINAADGALSIRRAYTVSELRSIIEPVLDLETQFTISVGFANSTVMVDIEFSPSQSGD